MSEVEPPRLTVVALAWNESRHLPLCFKSLEPLTRCPEVDTLVLLDAQADEATTDVAHLVADRVLVSRFVNFSAQRNRALDDAGGDWVFFIDPDERCTPALARDILAAISQRECAAYRVPRRNVLFGREVRHTGWYPDYQVRLLERDRVRYDETREVHEFPIVSGETGTLQSPLVHLNYDNWRQFFRKQWAYAGYEARALRAAGRRGRLRSIFGQPLREFKRRYVDYKGYRDGLLGLALSIAMAVYTGETYRRLWLLSRRDA